MQRNFNIHVHPEFHTFLAEVLWNLSIKAPASHKTLSGVKVKIIHENDS